MPAELQAMLGEETSLRMRVPPNASKTLLPFTAILGVTMGQLGLEENAVLLNKKALIQYVRYTSKPIGMINLTGNISEGEHQIMFAKPFIGTFPSVTILVFLPDRIGILVEEDGVATVNVSALPQNVMERWKMAGLVQLRQRQAVPEDDSAASSTAPLLVQAAQKKGPRIAPIPKAMPSAL